MADKEEPKINYYEREDGAGFGVREGSAADQRLARAVKAGEAKTVKSLKGTQS